MRIDESRSFLRSPTPIIGSDFKSRPVDPPSSVVHTTKFRLRELPLHPHHRLIRPIGHLRVSARNRRQSRASAENDHAGIPVIEAQDLFRQPLDIRRCIGCQGSP